ncbi:hypothetical protein BC628DRAFT_257196 [Trametes gibbosa]|nr:hypothetical protein BC628DRAFT_257196 [Trametes gibbosa]
MDEEEVAVGGEKGDARLDARRQSGHARLDPNQPCSWDSELRARTPVTAQSVTRLPHAPCAARNGCRGAIRDLNILLRGHSASSSSPTPYCRCCSSPMCATSPADDPDGSRGAAVRVCRTRMTNANTNGQSRSAPPHILASEFAATLSWKPRTAGQPRSESL